MIPSPLIGLFCSLIIAFAIIECCIILSNLIRMSPTLGHYLFGQKIEKKIPDNKKTSCQNSNL